MKKHLLLIPIAALTICAAPFNAPVNNGTVFNLSMVSSRGMSGNITVYYDVPGTRIEVNASANGFPVKKTSIVKKAEPNTVYQLDDNSKTYTVTDVSHVESGKTAELTKATLIGSDSLNGYFCKHCKVTQGTKTWEVWTTSAITEYTQFSAVMNNQRYLGNHDMHDALKTINADGFPVKTILTDKDGTTTTELRSVEHKPLDAALFAIPQSYKEGAAPAAPYPGMPGH